MSGGQDRSCPSTLRRPLDALVRWEPRGALRHGNDHVSFLVPLLDVRVGLDDLLQRVAPVDDRPDLPGLDEFLEEDKVLGTPTSRLAVLQTPVTSAPNDLASCTAYVPTLPEAP